MRYASILKADIANGPGFRVSLFVQGCLRKCPGCFNPETHDPDGGKPFGDAEKKKIFDELGKKWCRGLSILGGDPMSACADNRAVVLDLCKEVKRRFPGKTIWMWTGYLYEELKIVFPEILDCVDVIVDGPFVEKLKDLSLEWRGSSNQRIIYVKK